MAAKSPRKILTALLLLFTVAQTATSMAPHVNATQVTNAAPTLWRADNLELGVMVPSNPSWAYDSAIRAMQEWNRVQEQFIQTYYPNDTGNDRYTFYNTTMNPSVIVTFGVEYGAAGSNLWSPQVLAVTTNDDGIFNIQVKTSLTNVPGNSSSMEVLYRIMLHEFGHVLGLGEMYGVKDIADGNAYFLNDLSQKSYISTVDLYAIHYLAELGNAELKPYSFIFLPATIPYQLIDVDQ